MIPPFLQAAAEGAVISLYIQPRAGKNEIVGPQGEELKVRLTAPPLEGAANRLCCDFFARLLRVAKSDLRIVAGEKSRHKRLLVRHSRVEELQRTLAPHLPAE